MQYKTRGTCSQLINLELDGDVIKSVEFIGGCDGNLQGISKLVTGMKAEDAIKRLEGIQCGSNQHPVRTSSQKHFVRHWHSKHS